MLNTARDKFVMRYCSWLKIYKHVHWLGGWLWDRRGKNNITSYLLFKISLWKELWELPLKRAMVSKKRTSLGGKWLCGYHYITVNKTIRINVWCTLGGIVKNYHPIHFVDLLRSWLSFWSFLIQQSQHIWFWVWFSSNLLFVFCFLKVPIPQVYDLCWKFPCCWG